MVFLTELLVSAVKFIFVSAVAVGAFCLGAAISRKKKAKKQN